MITGARRLLQQDMSSGHAERGPYVIPQSLLTGQSSAILQGLLDVGLLFSSEQKKVAEELVRQFLMRASFGV